MKEIVQVRDIDTEWEIMDLLNYTVPRVPAGNSILFTWDLAYCFHISIVQINFVYKPAGTPV